MGGVARDLGNAYIRTGLRLHNESALFRVLRHPERAFPPEGLPRRRSRTRGNGSSRRRRGWMVRAWTCPTHPSFETNIPSRCG